MMRRADAEARVDRANRRVGEFIQSLTEGRGAKGVPEGTVTRLTVRLPAVEEPEALLVVRAVGADGAVVAFVGGLDVTQAVLIWAARDAGFGLKWREDLPWPKK